MQTLNTLRAVRSMSPSALTEYVQSNMSKQFTWATYWRRLWILGGRISMKRCRECNTDATNTGSRVSVRNSAATGAYDSRFVAYTLGTLEGCQDGTRFTQSS